MYGLGIQEQGKDVSDPVTTFFSHTFHFMFTSNSLYKGEI